MTQLEKKRIPRVAKLLSLTAGLGIVIVAATGCKVPAASAQQEAATAPTRGTVSGAGTYQEQTIAGIPVRLRSWPNSPESATGKLSRDEAAHRAIQFCQRLGVPLHSRLEVVTHLEPGYGIPKQPFWTVQLIADEPTLSRGGGYEVSLRASDDEPIGFKNQQREWEVINKVNRNRPHALSTPDNARQVLWQYAQRLGPPTGAVLQETGEIDWNRKWSLSDEWRERGEIRGIITLPAPSAYRLYPGKFPGLSISVDPVDGALRSLSGGWSFSFAPANVQLKEAQAIARARTLLGEERFIRSNRSGSAANPFLAPPKAELRYVHGIAWRTENGQVPANPTPQSGPPVYRLAWLVLYGDHQHDAFTEVWIDATDGTCLGGVEHSHWGSSAPASGPLIPLKGGKTR